MSSLRQKTGDLVFFSTGKMSSNETPCPAPYERRMIELLKVSREKRALRFAKRRVRPFWKPSFVVFLLSLYSLVPTSRRRRSVTSWQKFCARCVRQWRSDTRKHPNVCFVLCLSFCWDSLGGPGFFGGKATVLARMERKCVFVCDFFPWHGWEKNWACFAETTLYNEHVFLKLLCICFQVKAVLVKLYSPARIF